MIMRIEEMIYDKPREKKKEKPYSKIQNPLRKVMSCSRIALNLNESNKNRMTYLKRLMVKQKNQLLQKGEEKEKIISNCLVVPIRWPHRYFSIVKLLIDFNWFNF